MVIKYVIRGGKVTESDGKKKVVAHLPDGPNRHLQVMYSHPPGGDYDERLLDNIPTPTRTEVEVRPFSPHSSPWYTPT